MSEISLEKTKQDSEEATVVITCKFTYSKLRNDGDQIKEAFEELMNKYAI